MHLKFDKMASENDCAPGPSPARTAQKRKLKPEDVRKQWNLVKLYQRTSDELLAVKFAEELGLLPTQKICKVHKLPMPLYTCESVVGVFQCSRGTCRSKKKISRAKGTWFEEARIPVQRIMYLMYCFSRKFSYENVIFEDFTSLTSCVSTKTIANWYGYCREMIVDYFLENQDDCEKIGGPGRVVQIDENRFGRRRSNKGRQIDGHLVLGMIEEGSEDVRLQVCPGNISGVDDLIPLIKKHVHEGTTIHTDSWSAYDSLEQHGYIHKKVNNSDPDNPLLAENGTHAQKIESQWRAAKKAFESDSNNHNFADWVVEYQWRRNIKNKLLDPFDELVKAILYTYEDFRKQ